MAAATAISDAEHIYDPREIEARWQGVWASERTWEVTNEHDAGGRVDELVRARDAAVPERRAAHRPPEVLRGRRRDRALPSPPRAARAAPDGLRRVRPAGGEPRDQNGRAPARLDGRVDRLLPAPVPLVGDLDRLVARAGDLRTELLPLDAVDLPRAVPRGPRIPQGGGGQVVPARPDGARERAGRR